MNFDTLFFLHNSTHYIILLHNLKYYVIVYLKQIFLIAQHAIMYIFYFHIYVLSENLCFHSLHMDSRGLFDSYSCYNQEVHNMKDTTEQPVIRNYKDTLFRKLFSEKTNLLSLYNLITGKNYTNPDLLNIVTLDNAIYMNMKNDLAFLIDFSIYLFEHQSTTSPNMALRYLFYASKEYEKFINMTTIYSSKQIELPAPHFIVFYNGSERDWSIRTSKLSDSFKPKQQSPNLELIVKEININLGVNDERLSQCKVLFDYMQYIEKVRTYAKSMATALAVEKAVNECIKQGILKDFLLRYKSEAIQMSIFEYDQERELKLIRADEREIGWKDGHKQGLLQGIQQGEKEGLYSSINLFVKYDLEHNVTEDVIIQKVKNLFGFEEKEIIIMIQNAKNAHTT